MTDLPAAAVTAEEAEHHCWWRRLAEGLAATLTELDNDSADSALRQILRSEQARRRAAEQRVVELEAAAPHITAAERKRIRQLAEQHKATYKECRCATGDDLGNRHYVIESPFADLLTDTP